MQYMHFEESLQENMSNNHNNSQPSFADLVNL